MADHKLKIWPEFFERLRNGYTTCQIRKNDRDFKAGDNLVLQEYLPGELDRKAGPEAGRLHKADGTYSGSWIRCKISEVHKDMPGLYKAYCVLSLNIEYNNCGFTADLAGTSPE